MTSILVIEDDPAIRANVLELLAAEGFRGRGAENGRVGVEAARAEPPDLVICDVMMPELDGYGVLAALRAVPETAHVPFIFLTARADRSEIRAGMNLGADDYLTKPFSRRELLEAIQGRLRRKAAMDAGGRVKAGESEARVGTTPEEPRMSLPPPGTLIDGKIEVLKMLGAGGMGAVFEGLHKRTGRRVAVKVLRPSRLPGLDAIRRFQQEALACGRIEHPNVVEVLDAGEHEGAPYLVMELLRGESLEARIARDERLPVADAVRIVREALAGVGAAHGVGIVHRDLKPDNLFLHRPTAGGEIVKVVDFGASKLTETEEAGTLTRTGAVLGTAHYMSPEQARGQKDIDARADVYALGAVLYHALTGRMPFEEDNYNAVMDAILTKEPAPPRSLRAEIPIPLEDCLRRAMQRSRELRFATTQSFATALESSVTGA